VHGQQRQVEEGLGHEVAVGDGVEGVLEARREVQLLGHPVRVQGQRRTGQRPGPQRTDVETNHALQEPVDIAGQGPAVSQEVVSQEHRLGSLQMGVAG